MLSRECTAGPSNEAFKILVLFWRKQTPWKSQRDHKGYNVLKVELGYDYGFPVHQN